MNYPPYSVLLSVCNFEKSMCLSMAQDRMINQAIEPAEIVFVLDKNQFSCSNYVVRSMKNGVESLMPCSVKELFARNFFYRM